MFNETCKPNAEGVGNPTAANADPSRMVVLTVEVDSDLRRQFKAASSLRGMSMREGITALMTDFISATHGERPAALSAAPLGSPAD